MLNLIITIDYEIFGNGRGDVIRHMIIPMGRIASIAEAHNVPVTVMAEMCEYIQFEKYDEALVNDLGYSPSERISTQILEMHERGHDVQLHIHPQFLDAEYSRGRFHLRNPKLSVFDMSYEDVRSMIEMCKDTLESLVPSGSYRCLALRLSNMGWVEPPYHVAKAMEDLGIVVHSLSDIPAPAGNNGLWRLYDLQVYEVPIYSIPAKLHSFLKPGFLLPLLYVWVHDPPTSPTGRSSLKGSGGSGRVMKFDISKLSWREMVGMLDHALNVYDTAENEVPVVAIGHTKDFFNSSNFKKFLEIVTRDYSHAVRFTTFSEFVEQVLSG
ncbi:hypothetical protein [Geoglobus acetivorans]|uniref:ChbG/HpnK family deacetylase n=1 Tax=Geoglobus acetivorans TaxID=565033 RepID=A0ABZ3H2X8_GEOAI|nr:hypothetical protein [Geoglobus acetivorans]